MVKMANWFTSLLSKFMARQSHPISSDSAALMFGQGADTAAGIKVSPATAVSSTTVLACVRNIAEDIAKLPLHLLRETIKGEHKYIKHATDHPLYWLLYAEPNPYQTSFEFREWMQASMLVYGYGVAEIERDAFGMIVGLWPLLSPNVQMKSENGNIGYLVSTADGQYALRPDQVLHIKGFSIGGLLGSSLPVLAKESVALDLAYQQFAGSFFGNGAAPRGALSHPSKVGDVERLKKTWNDAHQGLSNANRIAVLEEGMKFEQIGISPKDSQAIEGRQFQVAEVCRVFRMQPHKVFELSRATFSNIEHQAIENTQDTLQPHISRWEQRINKSLLMPSEKRTRQLYVKFNIASLLRGDLKTQTEHISTMIDKGVYSINMALEFLDQNPIEGGDVHRVQVNTAPLGSDAANGNTANAGSANNA